MESILLIILIGLAGGIAVGLQSPMASMITQRLGVFESIFIVHIGGAAITLIPLLIFGNKLSQWRSLPWYLLGAGIFGLVVVASISYMIPHIYHVPFYVYAYAFGQVLVFSLYQQYKAEGESFKPKYLKILSAGGSEAPVKILAEAGVDIRDPKFWRGGFDVLSRMVDELEKLPVEVPAKGKKAGAKKKVTKARPAKQGNK